MIQVLKEELRQAMIKEAQNEFVRHGYLSASIKRIAARAGISVGNLYRYYPGKEALFEAVVEPVCDELEQLLNHHEDKRSGKEHISEQVVQILTEVAAEYRIPLLILVDGAKGTRYEDTVQKLHHMMADNVANHLKDYNKKQGQVVYEEQAAWPISVAFMQGFFEIIRRHQNQEECKSMVRQYVSFWYQGLQAFL